MSITTVTVTAIRVRTNTDSMFDGMSSDEIAATDIDATIDAYFGEVVAELKEDYPQARISIRHDSVYNTEVSTDTDHDNVRDDSGDTRTAVLEAEQRVQNAVDDALAYVWERGTFWVEK